MAHYWNKNERKHLPNAKIDAFMAEIEAVCRKHDLCISHQDFQGAFIIQKCNEDTLDWLKGAEDGTSL
jgi:hypothetical protein